MARGRFWHEICFLPITFRQMQCMFFLIQIKFSFLCQKTFLCKKIFQLGTLKCLKCILSRISALYRRYLIEGRNSPRKIQIKPFKNLNWKAFYLEYPLYIEGILSRGGTLQEKYSPIIQFLDVEFNLYLELNIVYG